MEKQENKKTASLRDWVIITIGIILIGLTIIGATEQTFIGEFLTYSSAYVFGMFYPVFYVIMVIIGLRLCHSRKFFPIKGKGMFWIGMVLLSLSLLAFGSFSVYTSEKTSFIALNDTYNNRMKGFASTPFEIDSFSALSSLGGGYIGLFLLTLFGSIWLSVGDAIFFSFLLLFALFMISFKPIHDMVLNLKEKKAKKVKYNSPYQGKDAKHLERGKSEEEIPPLGKNIDPSLTEPLTSPSFQKHPQGGFTTSSMPILTEEKVKQYEGLPDSPLPIPHQTLPREEKKEPLPIEQPKEKKVATISYSSVESQPFTPASSSFPNPSKSAPQAAFQPASPAPVQKETPAEKPQNNQSASPFTPAKTTLTPEQDKKISIAAEDFSKQAQSPEATTFPLQEETVKTPSYYQPPKQPEEKKPVINPLQAAARNAGPSIESKPQNEFKFEDNTISLEDQDEIPMEKEEPKPVLTEEEKEEKIEEEYYAEKRQREADAIQKKKAEKEAKKEKLYQFVSDRPIEYNYALPTDAMLENRDDSQKLAINNESANEKGKIINSVFSDYGIRAKVISFTIGASVTRFNVETEAGEKSEKLNSIISELQKALNGDKSVRVETVVEGKSTSGIEVGNKAPMAVSFKSAFKAMEANTKDNLLLPIGQDISGQIITYPLNKMPHLLVAGTTGSGKSVLIHSMIMTLIMRNYPSKLKLILIDPKQVEFIRYQGESHLYCPVISKPTVAVKALAKLCQEMEKRFKILSDNRCSNLEEYDALRQGRENELPEIPSVVCVIDEFADLMQTAGGDVAKYVQRLAQKARAAGIYLIIATQRPSKDTVPMVIKANISCRIGLSCSSQVDSRVILDECGAETLLGKGDLLFKCPTKKSLIRAQSPYISNEEIDHVLDYVKKQAGNPNYNPDFLDLDDEEEDIEEEKDPNLDEVYESIKDFIIHTGLTSKTTLMRNFNLTSLKVDQYYSKLVADDIIELGPGGKYVLSPSVTL